LGGVYDCEGGSAGLWGFFLLRNGNAARPGAAADSWRARDGQPAALAQRSCGCIKEHMKSYWARAR
jgi:hypothetical protein